MTEDDSPPFPSGSALLAHELQAPLTVLRAQLEAALEASWCKGEAGSMMRACLEQVQDMTQLLVDVLLLEKAESGRLAVRQEEVDLDRLTRDTVKNLMPLAEAKSLLVDIKLEAGLRMIGDPGQIKRLLANLIENAIKYTDAGGTVSVEGGRSGPYIVLRIKDTGLGVHAGHLHRIFERFYQVERERSREDRGCGLGLSIARALAERNGGSIDVESMPGKGSCFTFKIRRFT